MSEPRIIDTKKIAPAEFADIDSMHENAVHLAETMFPARNTHQPIQLWMIRCAQNFMVTFDTPWEDVEEKRRSTAVIASMMFSLGASFYSFVSEAWVAVFDRPSAADLERIQRTGLEQHADKESKILIISAGRDDGTRRETHFAIREHRLAHKRRLLARDDVDQRGLGFSGPMVNLFQHAIFNPLSAEGERMRARARFHVEEAMHDHKERRGG